MAAPLTIRELLAEWLAPPPECIRAAVDADIAAGLHPSREDTESLILDLEILDDASRILAAARPVEGTGGLVGEAVLWALGHRTRLPELADRHVDAALVALDAATSDDPETEHMARHVAHVIRERYT